MNWTQPIQRAQRIDKGSIEYEYREAEYESSPQVPGIFKFVIASEAMSKQTVIDEYSRQYQWRSWPIVFDAMPNCDGQTVLDLGCGIGDLAVDLAKRGAHVIGIDANEDFLQLARRRAIRNAEFHAANLRSFSEPNLKVDGIWSSFTAAYFPAFDETLSAWAKFLHPGGWIVLTEIDDLFGHKPLSERTRLLLEDYAKDSLSNSRYDFHMGRKLADALRRAGFVVSDDISLPDTELSFKGAARPDVLAAWRSRFDRMNMLRTFCGDEFEAVRDDFLNCLAREDHRCTANVRCVIAARPISATHL